MGTLRAEPGLLDVRNNSEKNQLPLLPSLCPGPGPHPKKKQNPSDLPQLTHLQSPAHLKQSADSHICSCPEPSPGASDPNLKPWAWPESGHTAPPPLLPRAPPHPGFHSDCCAFRVLQLPYRSTWRFPFLYYAWDPRHSRIRRLEVFIIFGKLQPYLQPNPMKFSIYASSYFLYVLLELTGFLLDTVILMLLKVSFIVSYSLLLSRQFLQLHLSAH